MPPLVKFFDGRDNNVVRDAFERPIAPCILTEPGESLDFRLNQEGPMDPSSANRVRRPAEFLYAWR